MKLFKKNLTLILSFVFILSTNLKSQSEVQKPGIGRGNLYSQFNYAIYQSEQQENYRIVKSWWLYNLRNQVRDSIQLLNDSIVYFENVVLNSDNEIDSLNNVISELNKELHSTQKEMNSIHLLGIKVDKKIYNAILWSIIGVVVFLLFLFIIMFKRSNVITVRSKNDLREVRDEFEAFRKKALVREQQLVRNMYDEVLKYKNKVRE